MTIRQHQAFRHMNWNPGRKELREFAIAMLLGFSVLGALGGWRSGGSDGLAVALVSAGLLLAVAAFIPGLGRTAYLAVYVPSMAVGYLVSRVLLTVLFYGLFFPLGLVLRMTGHDPLRLRATGTQWQKSPEASADGAYRQF